MRAAWLAILLVLGGVPASLRAQPASETPASAPPKKAAAAAPQYQVGAVPRERVRVMYLEWLAQVQDPETGAWSLTGREERSRYADGSLRENRCQATALALLALQGAGSTPHKGTYSKHVAKGWKFLLSQQREDGSIVDRDRHELFLTHAQCMLALSEIYGMTRDPQFLAAAQNSLNFAIGTQHRLGGWGALPATDGKSADSNTAVTCWMTLALSSAQHNRMKVPPETLKGITGYLDRVQTADGQYRATPHPTSPESDALLAQGLLARILLGGSRNDPRIQAGVRRMVDRLPTWEEPDATYWYFATQVAHHIEGSTWSRWNSVMRDQLIELQITEVREQGSWDPRSPKPDRWGSGRGRLYVTCLSAYSLQVYYRHLPIYSKIAFRDDPKAPPKEAPASGGLFSLLFGPKHRYDVADDAVRKLGGEEAFAEKLGVSLSLAKDDPYQGLLSLYLSRTKITDAGLAELGKLPELQSLDLNDTQISDAGVKQLARLPLLESLALNGTQVSDAGLSDLKNLPVLERLSVGRTGITDAGVRELKECKTLRELTLDGTRVTGAGLSELTSLHGLNLGRSQVNDTSLQGFHRLGALRSLNLRGTQVSDAGVLELGGLIRLKSLHLDETQITDKSAEALGRLVRLEELSLDKTRVGDTTLARLVDMRNLKYLTLVETQITDAGVVELAKLPRLEGLTLSKTKISGVGFAGLKGVRDLTLEETTLTEAGLAEVGQMERLERLDLSGAKFPVAGFAGWKNFELSSLKLAKTNITDDGLRHLRRQTGLYSLELSGAPITDAGVAHLAELSRLWTLELDDTPVTDKGIAHLKDIKELITLRLANTQVTGAGLRGFKSVTDLDLSGSPVTDEGLESLRGLPVRKLNLSRTKITDASIKVLLELESLRDLTVEGTEISKEGREKLAPILR